MKFEDLKSIVLKNGKPNPNMIDSQWQEYFNLLKISICQCEDKCMRAKASPILVNGYISDSQFEYHGETQWYRYRMFINNILSAIRSGESDYCYYIYQIEDLLKYEHDNLETLWLPEYECFQVWLKK